MSYQNDAMLTGKLGQHPDKIPHSLTLTVILVSVLLNTSNTLRKKR